MTVAVDTSEVEVEPGLDEVRALSRGHTVVPLRHTFIDDCETPVSAYLKLRGEGPSFLLESAEQGRVGLERDFLHVDEVAHARTPACSRHPIGSETQ